jgi:Ca-activated chloride channel homolog
LPDNYWWSSRIEEEEVNESNGSEDGSRISGVQLTLLPRQERKLIRPVRGFRHIAFHVEVSEVPAGQEKPRTPLALSMVLDRSGSMAGDKIETAKKAALAVLDKLDERDQVGLVVFDDEIEVVQPAEPVTPRVKAKIRSALAELQARASTALYEGWLSGCRLLAGDQPFDGNKVLARCFLLTDGLANRGLTDPEQIATQAADVRRQSGIGTSTFGIGPDYDEALLGPMAVAGGGQFHNLRTPEEIANTFIGELGDLLAVAARQVRLAIEVGPGVDLDVVSPYPVSSMDAARINWSIDLGDLLGGAQQDAVIRFGFPAQEGRTDQVVRSRLLWVNADGETMSTDWQESVLTYASHGECDREARDPDVMRLVGLRHSERAQREAIKLSRQGDFDRAKATLHAVECRIGEYAGSDAELNEAIARLREAETECVYNADPLRRKERYFASQIMSKGQQDYRSRRS